MPDPTTKRCASRLALVILLDGQQVHACEYGICPDGCVCLNTSHVHSQDTLVRSQQDEINRLRSQLVDAASTPPSGAQAGGGGYRPAPSGAPGGGGYRPEPISQQANTSNGDAAHSKSEQPKNAKPHSRGWFGR